MISVHDRYVPSQRALSLFPHAPRQERSQTFAKTPAEAFSWICGLLAYDRRIHEINYDGVTVTIVTQELGRNTHSLFETTFSGSMPEMRDCLAAAFYWYDGDCVEPPADYPFREGVRQQVLDGIAQLIPLRDRVGDMLRALGYEPLKLKGLYDIRGCAPMKVGVMAFAGISDPVILSMGAAMDFRKLFDVCEYMRVFGMTFEEALAA